MRFSRLAVLGIAGLFAVTSPAGAQEKDSEIAGKKLDQWVRELRDLDPSVRENAMRNVVLFGKFAQQHPDCLPALESALTSQDASLRVNAVIAIGMLGVDTKVGDPKGKALVDKIVFGLQNLLSDQQAAVRFHTVTALARLGPRFGKPVINRIAGSGAGGSIQQYGSIRDPGSWEIRRAAASALGVLAYDLPENGPDGNALKVLATAAVGSGTGTLPDSCALVRLEAINSLLMLAPIMKPNDLKALQRTCDFATKDKDKTITIWARYGLIQVNLLNKTSTNNEVYVKAIGDLMVKDPDLHVRCQACRAVSLLGKEAKSQIFPLIGLLRDKQPILSDAAGAAIFGMASSGNRDERILSEAHFKEISRLLEESDSLLRTRGAQMLATLGPLARSEVPALIAALKNPKEESEVLVPVMLALGEMKESAKPALPVLVQLLKHPNETVQDTAQEAIKLIEGRAEKPKPAPKN